VVATPSNICGGHWDIKRTFAGNARCRSVPCVWNNKIKQSKINSYSKKYLCKFMNNKISIIVIYAENKCTNVGRKIKNF
jgi:hypothetical protein